MITIIMFVLTGVFTLVSNLLNGLPFLTFQIPFESFQNIQSLFNGIAFFLPIGTISLIFEIKLGLIGFRIIWSIILRVKSFIPTISST